MTGVRLCAVMVALAAGLLGQEALGTAGAQGCAAPSPRQTAGPFYKTGSPERRSLLEAGVDGQRLVVSGLVLTKGCRPLSGVWIDFWQADGGGVYDNAGYRMRGHQYTDAEGRYWLESVVPGRYPGRTPHLHVSLQAPGGPVVITQLYLPGEPGNARDSIFNPALTVTAQEVDGSIVAGFDFVLDLE